MRYIQIIWTFFSNQTFERILPYFKDDNKRKLFWEFVESDIRLKAHRISDRFTSSVY